ncbi:MAG: 4-hydroxy-tetrahydrodipicolinate reductase [Desulfohalobiaceae bacterium]|nr:4-hydroxy-tetrahydrodipicolinate reductase [Desulfohalobiaceae bacterium]
MSKTEVVIMGAGGRMGSTLVNLVQKDQDLELAGVLEHPDFLNDLKDLGCPKDTNLERLLPKAPGAVVVDFTQPEAAMDTVRAAQKHKNSLVIGTTGFSREQQKALEEAAAVVPIFWSPNMSVGINVLLELLPELTRMLGPDYDVELSEIHHKYKKDAPSGTALKLAETLSRAKGWEGKETQRYCREGITGERPEKEIGLQSLRGGDVVGEHTVYFLGPGERIDITHRAYSRETFAKGALRAAQWLRTRKSGKLYAMRDLFF